MSFTIPKEIYSGKIKEMSVGNGDKSVKVGGESTFPFLTFEGEIPNIPRIAVEITDVYPEDWADPLKSVYGDIMKDVSGWAKYVEEKIKPDMLALRLIGTHPDRQNRSAIEAADTVKKVVDAINIPLIILGSNHVEKDTEIIQKCAEAAKGKSAIIGKAQEANYKTFAAAATSCGHSIIALSDLDINLAKQLNILLTQSGFPAEKIFMDTMSSALGYGMEYTFSVIERIKIAALMQNDTMMQMPIVNDVGIEAWKVKESKDTTTEVPMGVMWEAITSMSFLSAGGDMLIMRHPEAVNIIRKTVNKLYIK
ncbi:acetyl-CoA decarbonylase/synthase complex subunit delta [Candidatus Desantisbacteria bacterium]|nr:acetyl-CoA decarbonylase/synthase complex subunit delta [Candidatus Desantisbacteria bacterium]